MARSYPLYVWDPATEQWLGVCGPAGPQGPAGPAGPPGAQGPPGAAGAGPTIPAGAEAGDMLWWDGSGWQVLSPSSTAADVLTMVQSGGGDLLPEWQALPPQVVPRLAQRQCGAARRVAQKLVEAYQWTVTEMQAALLAWLRTAQNVESVANAVLGWGAISIPYGWDEHGNPVGGFSFSPARIILAAGGAMINNDINDEIAQLAPLTPGQIDDVAQAIYCPLLATPGVAVSTVMEDVCRNLAGYANWVTHTQPMILQWCLLFLPPASWDRWAQQGAADPSNSCGDFTCAIFG